MLVIRSGMCGNPLEKVLRVPCPRLFEGRTFRLSAQARAELPTISEPVQLAPMFELLEHTADIGFRATARTLPQLFENAAEALVSVAMDVESIQARESYSFVAEGDSPESLLVNWLSEVLYQLDGESRAMRAFRVEDLQGGRMSGKAFGEPRDPKRHTGRLIVKGITYHQLKLEQTPSGWSCEVYLDV